MKGKDSRKRKRRNQHGIITVFVTLIMVPVVVITGILVDAARIKFYSSQALMAADSYGETVLSQYDYLLKQLYGLFSVTQDKEGLEAVETLKKYSEYSFQPNGDDKGLSGFMPFQNADVQLDYTKVDGASLSDNNVLMTQINDFMKYRIIEEVLEAGGILDNLGRFDSTSNDMDTMKARNDITKESAKILEEIGDYYQDLKKLAGYPAFLSGCEVFYADYAKTLKAIVNPAPGEDTAEYDKYEKYYDYIHSSEKDAIDQAYAYFEGRTEDGEEEGESDDEPSADELERMVELYDQHVDTETYLRDLRRTIEVSEALLKDYVNNKEAEISFRNADKVIDSLGETTETLQKGMEQLKNQVQSLKEKLPGCSEEVRKGIEEEIKDLQEIIDQSPKFQKVYDLIRTENHYGTKENNQSNFNLVSEETARLDTAKTNILNGNAEKGKSDWRMTIRLTWVDFRDDREANSFYEWLKELCETGDGGSKKAGDKEIKKANGAEDDAVKELDKDEEPREGTRDISSELAQQLQSAGGTSGDVPGLTDYFAGGMSFQGLADAGTDLLSKFMLATYDFGMFSSRVTGVAPEGTPVGEGSEEYADYSLTEMKMGRDINYLYGAELEYLFGGYNSSKENLNHTRNVICGVRLTMNFIASYTIDEINSAISTIANTAAAFGGPAAPLVRVAVSGALRAAFSAIETVGDWNSLMKREGVLFLKTELGDLQSLDKLKSLFSDIEEGSTPAEHGLKLSYENYMYILLVLMVDKETLLSRTSDLITLNVNQAENKEENLQTLDFKMTDTVTAVKSTCKVKMDFVVLPERFAELFLKGSNAEQVIESAENHYFGYSVIRGY